MNTHNMSMPQLTDYHSIIPFIPPSLQPFLSLQYPVPARSSVFRLASSGPTLYSKGIKDIYLPITCALTFTLLRELCIRYVFSNFARLYLGSSNAKDPRIRRRANRKIEGNVVRFSEQGWSFVYCTVFWILGVVTLYQRPNPTSPEQLWGTYPVTHLTGLTKFYYLAQLGWWFHQIYVINTEKRRSDHWQMCAHHVLTIGLITTSYMANFTRVGVLIHVLMDFCDIWLPLAKMFRYMACSNLCDLTFIVFLIGWFFSRQVGLALVIRTSYLHAPQYISFKWSPSTGHYLTKRTYWGFIGLQVLLYTLATMWFYLAIMVAVRVVRGQGAQDSRSDDEGEDGDEGVDGYEGSEVKSNGGARVENGSGGSGSSSRSAKGGLLNVEAKDLNELSDCANADPKSTAARSSAARVRPANGDGDGGENGIRKR